MSPMSILSLLLTPCLWSNCVIWPSARSLARFPGWDQTYGSYNLPHCRTEWASGWSCNRDTGEGLLCRGYLGERESKTRQDCWPCLNFPFPSGNPGRVVPLLWPCSYWALQPDANKMVFMAAVAWHSQFSYHLKETENENITFSSPYVVFSKN